MTMRTTPSGHGKENTKEKDTRTHVCQPFPTQAAGEAFYSPEAEGEMGLSFVKDILCLSLGMGRGKWISVVTVRWSEILRLRLNS